MGNNYSVKEYNKENMARAFGRSLPISFKQSVEICNFIRNRNINYAKDVLNKVIVHKQAIPLRRFNANTGHKKKMAAGRYPKKASMEILKLINSVEANAQFRGLNTANLVMHYGRKRSRWAKRTNMEIVVEEKSEDKKMKSSNKKAKENKK
jgi:large subunit ribosomal protein L22